MVLIADRTSRRGRTTGRGSHVALLAAGAALLAAGCLRPIPEARLSRPTPVAALYVVDHDDVRPPGAVPAELRAQVAQALARRNAVAQDIPFARLGRRLRAVRDSRRRLEELARDRGQPLLLLVETKAVFYSLLNGRYKWNVYARITVARREALDRALAESADFTAHLDFDHEREPEALTAIAPALARRAGILLDTLLAAPR